MKRKRSRFLTFMFSMLPGAGHMFMGFMRMGTSIMSVFFLIILLSSWLGIGPLMYFLPVLWFYSFFDCINKRYSSDEEFYEMEDTYLFSPDKLYLSKIPVLKNQKLFAGVLLVLMGIYLIWNNFMHFVGQFIPQEVYDRIRDFTNHAPQVVFGVIIIMAGMRLIMGKKKECDFDA